MTSCIIVDDELPARELISLHLSGLTDFRILKSFENATDAFEFLQKNTVDLIFLDIQMPGVSGLSLIRSLKVIPKIILTTAFREYAIDAFELDVMDYLVKPITSERFMMAISRFHHQKASIVEHRKDDFRDAYIFLRIGNEQTRVLLSEILFIEAMKDYVKIHTAAKNMLASERLSYMEQKLPEAHFARVHKSFIVSLLHIAGYTTEQVTIGNRTLPIGRVYKNAFIKKLRK